jgi:hypothetical protein
MSYQETQSLFELEGAPLDREVEAGSNPSLIWAHESALYRTRHLQPETPQTIARAMATDAVAQRILAKGIPLSHGQVVGVRLNLSIIKSTGVAVHTIHRGGTGTGYQNGRGLYRGEVISYLPVVRLQHAWFNVHQKARQDIASGAASKSPMASIDGSLVLSEEPWNFDGVEVSFQPKRVHLFVDAANQAVQYAEQVTIMGHRAYARGRMRYFESRTAPPQAGHAPSEVVFASEGI